MDRQCNSFEDVKGRTPEEHRAVIKSYPNLQWFMDHSIEECKDRQKLIQLAMELGRTDASVSISFWCALAHETIEGGATSEKIKLLHHVVSPFVLRAHDFFSTRDKLLTYGDNCCEMLGTLRQQKSKLSLWSKPQLEKCSFRSIESNSVFLIVDEKQTEFAGQTIRMLRILGGDGTDGWWVTAAEFQKTSEEFV